jgi:hypothetical protein
VMFNDARRGEPLGLAMENLNMYCFWDSSLYKYAPFTLNWVDFLELGFETNNNINCTNL